ncbi:hypothetical protein ACH5RR_003540 [Cinchona calisaya]|uniref:Uncharacterized protein n=1 Tax=Cinchona calisaya TaxID=153742 RepID=A0ABD3AV37_9GENT
MKNINTDYSFMHGSTNEYYANKWEKYVKQKFSKISENGQFIHKIFKNFDKLSDQRKCQNTLQKNRAKYTKQLKNLYNFPTTLKMKHCPQYKNKSIKWERKSFSRLNSRLEQYPP